MKLTLILLIVTICSIAAESYSQTAKLNLKMENATVVDILKEIERTSEFGFFFKNDQIDLQKRISIDIENQGIEDVLKEILGDGYSYRFLDKNIVITLKPFTNTVKQDQKVIKGVVTDTNNSPLPGVTIVVKGTANGTITDVDGNYSLTNIPGDATLVFSFVGMKAQEVAVSGRPSINIVMQGETIGLEEVVAIGYGIQKKINMTGSVASVNSKKLAVAPITNAANALVGRLPGLISKQESGVPGSDAASLSIRGFGAALIIVDGVESKFSDIDVNEIESVSILKDAAAAIYGSRAGNGVILIRTKRGSDTKPIFTLNSSFSLQGVTKMSDPVSSGQYTEMQREAWLNAGKPENTAPFTQEEIDLYYSGTDRDYPNTNWLKEILRPWASVQQHNLSIRGGSDKIKYYGFFGFLDQPSLIKLNGGKYNRYNFRSNIDAKLLDNLSLQINVSSILGIVRFPWRPLGFAGDDSVWFDLWNSKPIYNATLPDPTKLAFTGATPINGISNREIAGFQDDDNQNVQGSIALNYDFKFIKGLKARAFFNYSQTYSDEKRRTIPFSTYSYNYGADIYTLGTTISNNSLLHQSYRDKIITGQLSLNFDRVFAEDHQISVLALYEIISYSGTYLSASRQSLLSPSINFLFGGSESSQRNYSSGYEMGRGSYVGRLNYSYKSRYLLESTLRYDASAKFPHDSRWGLFPSVSLGWRLSEEGFIKNSFSSLDNLKLRGSIGQTGNDLVGNFQYLTGYVFGNGYAIGNDYQKGITDKGLANPMLTWEEMTIYNLGVDLSMWKRKLYGEFDVFYRQRNGIPATRYSSLPSTFGATLPPENINSLNDRGFEAMLGNIGSLNDLHWDVSANISWSRSKWDHFEEPEYTDPDDIRINKNSGKWVDRTYGYLSDGLFISQEEINNLGFDQDQQGNTTLRPGDIKYKDLNGDKILDWRDQDEIGKGSFPHWVYGLNTTLSYNNFDCSILFQGAFGFNNNINIFKNSKLYYEERWTSENNNSNALIPRLGGSTMNMLISDRNFKDISYVRLKTLSIGYTIPEGLIKKLKMTNLRFYFAGTNLFTFSTVGKYLVDPESPSGTIMYYPPQRTLSFGLSLSL